MNNDLISREALKKAITLNRNIDRNAVCDVLDVIDNAPTIEPDKKSLDYDYGFAEGIKRTNERLIDKARKQDETNAELFNRTFGMFATELWSMPHPDFVEWLNTTK